MKGSEVRFAKFSLKFEFDLFKSDMIAKVSCRSC